MEIFVYNKEQDALGEGFSEEELPELLADPNNQIWIDFEARSQKDIKQAEHILINHFKFHRLAVEDCIETRNQPKVEEFPGYLFFIFHGIKNETNTANFITKELDGFLGENFVITFRHEHFRSIEYVKQHVRSNTQILKRGTAYLLHQILDRLVDMYMPLVDDFDVAINELEERVFLMRNSDNRILEEIMDLRRSVARLKRISARQLEVLYRISHGEFPQIPANVLPFFRDVHDHLLRISDLAENYRDLIGGLFEIHFSVMANKTNDVMKLLAVFSAIILPLSLIAGIYGMNFEHMPELRSPYGYFVSLLLMLIIALLELVYFWRKGWILERADKFERGDKEK